MMIFLPIIEILFSFLEDNLNFITQIPTYTIDSLYAIPELIPKIIPYTIDSLYAIPELIPKIIPYTIDSLSEIPEVISNVKNNTITSLKERENQLIIVKLLSILVFFGGVFSIILQHDFSIIIPLLLELLPEQLNSILNVIQINFQMIINIPVWIAQLMDYTLESTMIVNLINLINNITELPEILNNLRYRMAIHIAEVIMYGIDSTRDSILGLPENFFDSLIDFNFRNREQEGLFPFIITINTYIIDFLAMILF